MVDVALPISYWITFCFSKKKKKKKKEEEEEEEKKEGNFT
jgi:hypothetical protein